MRRNDHSGRRVTRERQGLPGVTVVDLERAGLPSTALYSCRFGLRLGLPWEPVVGMLNGNAGVHICG